MSNTAVSDFSAAPALFAKELSRSWNRDVCSPAWHGRDLADNPFLVRDVRIIRVYHVRAPVRAARREALLSLGNLQRINGCPSERACAAILQAQGWRVQVTRASGDYGADVVGADRYHRVLLTVLPPKPVCGLANLPSLGNGFGSEHFRNILALCIALFLNFVH